MGVIVSILISADGFRDRPTSWVGDLFDADAVEGSIQQLKSTDAFLMGRGSYEKFAPAWPAGGDPYSDALAALPKYVCSATLERTDWANTTIVRTDAVQAVRDLPGTSLMYGFGRRPSRCSRPGWWTSCTSASTRSRWRGPHAAAPARRRPDGQRRRRPALRGDLSAVALRSAVT